MPNRQQQRRSHLKEHVSNILSRKNVQIEYFYREQKNGDYMAKMMDMLKPKSFTLDNFSRSLETIASHLFSVKKGWSRYHIIALFIYCIKLDAICMKMHDWYNTSLLEETLVVILSMINYSPPTRNDYTIFPVVCMLGIFLVYFIST